MRKETDDGWWEQPDTFKLFNEHIILCFEVNPLELLMTTETNEVGPACSIYINHYKKNMDGDMCNSSAHYVGMCGQAFTNPQGNVWVNTSTNSSTGDGTHEYKSTGAIMGNCWKLCKYSATVEGICVRGRDL